MSSSLKTSNKKTIDSYYNRHKLFLNKKTKRTNFINGFVYSNFLKNNNNSNNRNYVLSSPPRFNKYNVGTKSVVRHRKQVQSTINDFFTPKTSTDETLSSDELNKNYNDIPPLSYTDSTNFSRNLSHNLSHNTHIKNNISNNLSKLKKKKLEEIPYYLGEEMKKSNNYKVIYDSDEDDNLDISSISQNYNYNSNNTISHFSNINNHKSEKKDFNNNNFITLDINNDKEEKEEKKEKEKRVKKGKESKEEKEDNEDKKENVNKEKNNFNYLINNGIFTKSEINFAMNIEEEFNEKIQGTTSEIDKLMKAIIFFINKGFTEDIRYIYYKCLINYGFPLLEKFNVFYNNFIDCCDQEKKSSPNKMYIEFYTEYIFNILKNGKISIAKKKLASEFCFNGEDFETIRNNLILISTIKENIINNHSYIQLYLEKNFDSLFSEVNFHLNKEFPKSKTVLCKIISNIVNECERNGYLKYKKIISNDDKLFEGLKIKGNVKTNLNLRKMISLKVFGQQLADKKFNNVIHEYFLQFFTNFKNENTNA